MASTKKCRTPVPDRRGNQLRGASDRRPPPPPGRALELPISIPAVARHDHGRNACPCRREPRSFQRGKREGATPVTRSAFGEHAHAGERERAWRPRGTRPVRSPFARGPAAEQPIVVEEQVALRFRALHRERVASCLPRAVRVEERAEVGVEDHPTLCEGSGPRGGSVRARAKPPPVSSGRSTCGSRALPRRGRATRGTPSMASGVMMHVDHEPPGAGGNERARRVCSSIVSPLTSMSALGVVAPSSPGACRARAKISAVRDPVIEYRLRRWRSSVGIGSRELPARPAVWRRSTITSGWRSASSA